MANQSSADAGNSKVQAPSAKNHLFKLNIDCLDKIFDYLSVKELHSVGQTCKTLNVSIKHLLNSIPYPLFFLLT